MDRIERAMYARRRWNENDHPRSKVGEFVDKTGQPKKPKDWHEPKYSFDAVPHKDKDLAAIGARFWTVEDSVTQEWLTRARSHQVFHFDIDGYVNEFKAVMNYHNDELEEIRQKFLKLDDRKAKLTAKIDKLRPIGQKLLNDYEENFVKTNNFGCPEAEAARKVIIEHYDGIQKMRGDFAKREIRGKHGDIFTSMIGTENPVTVQSVKTPPFHDSEPIDLDADQQNKMDQACLWLSRCLSRDTVETGGGQYKIHPLQTKYSRCFAKPHPGGGSIHEIHMTPLADIGSYVHEIGHTIEFSNRMAERLVNGFLYHRIGDDDPQRVPFDFAMPEEIGWKDNWEELFGSSASYVGKYYPRDATEIISMGLQKLYDDPLRFARLDPEYFKLIIGILRGTVFQTKGRPS